MYEVIIEERAEREFIDALEYYETLNVSFLVENFVEDLRRAISILEVKPHFEIRTRDFRGLPFDNFPFIVFFRIDEDLMEVRIVSIFHTSLNPQKYPE